MPPALQTECLRAGGDISSCWSCIEKFPIENRNMFIYFIGFITELMKQNSIANSSFFLRKKFFDAFFAKFSLPVCSVSSEQYYVCIGLGSDFLDKLFFHMPLSEYFSGLSLF